MRNRRKNAFIKLLLSVNARLRLLAEIAESASLHKAECSALFRALVGVVNFRILAGNSCETLHDVTRRAVQDFRVLAHVLDVIRLHIEEEKVVRSGPKRSSGVSRKEILRRGRNSNEPKFQLPDSLSEIDHVLSSSRVIRSELAHFFKYNQAASAGVLGKRDQTLDFLKHTQSHNRFEHWIGIERVEIINVK